MVMGQGSETLRFCTFLNLEALEEELIGEADKQGLIGKANTPKVTSRKVSLLKTHMDIDSPIFGYNFPILF